MTTPNQPEPGIEPAHPGRLRQHPVAVTAVLLLTLATAVTLATRQPPADADPQSQVGASPVTAVVTGSPVVPNGAANGSPGVTPSPSNPARPTLTSTPELASIIDSRRYSYEPGWGTLEVQAFLDSQPGTLKTLAYSAGGQRISLAAAVADQSLLYNINPKVVLTILEMESGVVRKAAPTSNELGWAMGYRQDKYWGVGPQVNWAARELYRSARDDQARIAARGWGSYSVARLLSQTVDRETQSWPFERAASVFVSTYRELFGEDPRTPPASLPSPATGPFLRTPFGVSNVVVSSAFDHEYPLLSETGTMLNYHGQRDQSSYDGHDGWDYVLSSGTPVVAAAAGRALVAGWSDDGCASVAGAVILDHDNGYRTIYWHLSSVNVQPGARVVAGDVIGKSGNTGCSLGAHLHFGVQFLGRVTDPYGWCPEGALKVDPWSTHPAGTLSSWLWTDKTNPCPVR